MAKIGFLVLSFGVAVARTTLKNRIHNQLVICYDNFPALVTTSDTFFKAVSLDATSMIPLWVLGSRGPKEDPKRRNLPISRL